MCRQKLRNEVPEAGKPALSCSLIRARKVKPLLRCSSTLRTSAILHQQRIDITQPRPYGDYPNVVPVNGNRLPFIGSGSDVALFHLGIPGSSPMTRRGGGSRLSPTHRRRLRRLFHTSFSIGC